MILQQVEVAKEAARCGDWGSVTELLRQLLQSADNNKPQQWQPEVQEMVLALALQVLETGDFSTRWHMAKLLPALGSIAIDPLITILEDSEADLEERWFAGRLLGQFRGPDVMAVLVQVLQQATDPDLSAIAAHALANQGTVAIPHLASLLTHPSACLHALHTLAQIPDASVVTPMLSVVTHADPEVRSAAILALSNFRDERILPVLMSAVHDRTTTVRRAAAIGLGRWATPNADEAVLLPVLTPLLKDWQMAVCEEAAIALGRLKTEGAVRVLATELRAPLTPLPLQIVLIRALAWTETSLALTFLQQALPQLPAPAVVELIQVLGRVSGESLQTQAASILLAFWSTYDALNEPESKILQALAHAWELLGDPRAIPALEQLKHHAQLQVVLHADSALKQLAIVTCSL
ncbi:HEAT repeat domain-containing protein [Vacuolonema iberomarrocanum]|uniref:HEAT repeat domain-containing protein n=1 Tax=Vacuolonema iberomarrocanum TaxID=3454632 RepID=UPI0019DD4BA6|nr:HEAT repeat domain-containing protein [filamentous cyanobacterium LEGE 07170]